MEHTHHNSAEHADAPAEHAHAKPESEALHHETQVVKPKADEYAWLKKINPRYLLAAIIIVAIVAIAFYNKSLLIAATVDGHIISRVSVIKQLEKQSGKTTLDTLINNQLISDEAKSQHIVISDDDINNQIKTITTQVTSQGGTLDAALTQAGMTMDDLKTQIVNELQIEKLLGDKVAVTDAEVDKYISDNKVTIPAGQEAATRDQIKQQLMQTKVSSQADQYITDLRLKAHIKTYVNY